MKICSTIDLREKEIINLCDGARLGCAQDFDFDVSCGRITALVISGEGGIFSFSKSDDIVIPWDRIQCIGEDTVLVKLSPEEVGACKRERNKKKRTQKL